MMRYLDPEQRVKPKELGTGEIIEGIAFDREKDTMEDGAMKHEKQQEFVDKYFNSLRIYKENGKNYFKGYLPNLPEGLE